MNPIKAILEINITYNLTDNVLGESFLSFVNKAYSERTTPGLEYIDVAKNLLEGGVKAQETKILEIINKGFVCKEYIELSNFDVKIEAQPSYNEDIRPIFTGTITLFIRSSEIQILQILPDNIIAYHSSDYPLLRFVQLSKEIECIISNYEE